MNKDFKAFGRFDNGFTLTFENGLVLSTRFGPGNYCDNYEMTNSIDMHMGSESMGNLFSDTAEVGVWDNAKLDPRSWVTGWQEVVFDIADPYDDVRGYVSLAEWLQIVDWCKEWKQ